MKEDILEQLVDEYLQHKGYFTRHNVKFKPDPSHPEYESKQDRVASDIDVIGFNPTLKGSERVIVVSCKSWQGGFDPDNIIKKIEEGKKESGRETWKGFRELVKEKWTSAFLDKVEEITESKKFTYITAVTTLKPNANKEKWENYNTFKTAMRGNPVKILTLNEILDELYRSIERTPAASSVGRLMQIIKASKWIEKKQRNLAN
ncbi:MAG: hypothetical protein V6Z81_02460 [Parvularculales bacterium]